MAGWGGVRRQASSCARRGNRTHGQGQSKERWHREKAAHTSSSKTLRCVVRRPPDGGVGGTGDILDPKPLPARGVLLLEGGALGGGGGGIKMGVGVEEWSPELAAEAAWQQQRRVAALFDKRKAEGRLKQLQALRERHDTRKSRRRSGRDGGGSGNAGLLQRLTGGSLALSGLDGGRPAGAAVGADSSGSRRKPSSPVAMTPAVGFGRRSRQRPEEASEDGEVFDILNTVNTILSISDHQRPSMFGAPASSVQLNLMGETPRPITATAATTATATAAAALMAAAANEASLGRRLLPAKLAVAGSSWSHSPAVGTVHTAGGGRSLSNWRPAQAAAAAAPALRCGQGSCSGRISTRLSMRPASPRHQELKRRASADRLPPVLHGAWGIAATLKQPLIWTTV